MWDKIQKIPSYWWPSNTKPQVVVKIQTSETLLMFRLIFKILYETYLLNKIWLLSLFLTLKHVCNDDGFTVKGSMRSEPESVFVYGWRDEWMNKRMNEW